MKVKVDLYIVRNKGKTHKVLAFPRVENAWAYDDSPEDDQLMLDGNEEFFNQLKYAMAALIADPSLLIYFSIKNPECRRSWNFKTYDAVLLRRELQFRRSEWYDIKGKLDRRHYAGKYKIHYNEKKLNDWYEKAIQGKRWLIWQGIDRIVEEILGETVFLAFPKNICYWYHHAICDSLANLDPTYEYGHYSYIGYIFPDEVLKKQAEEGK